VGGVWVGVERREEAGFLDCGVDAGVVTVDDTVSSFLPGCTEGRGSTKFTLCFWCTEAKGE
jgi:hypothetical protein